MVGFSTQVFCGHGACSRELAMVGVIDGLLVHARCEEEDVEAGCCARHSRSGGDRWKVGKHEEPHSRKYMDDLHNIMEKGLCMVTMVNAGSNMLTGIVGT